jgi:membrane associated rhomboid family serine protease
MLFIPFQADLQLYRFPIITLFICLLCILIYYGQAKNEVAAYQAGEAFCQDKGEVLWRMVMKKTVGDTSQAACQKMMWKIHLSDTPQQVIQEFADEAKSMAGLNHTADIEFKRQMIEEKYASFNRNVPKFNTQQLWYDPASWDIGDMITSSFAHGSWSHVLGNLFFFFAFAATIELILGPFRYAVVVLGLALGTNIFYSIAMLGVPDPLPTVGLSGVVMGIMCLFTFFLPWERIKCFLWLLIFIRILSVPAWLLVIWYIGWDIYDLFVLSEARSGVNLVAHVSGAALGYLIGIVFFRQRRRQIKAGMYTQDLPAT